MHDKTMTGGQALVRLLAHYAVDTVFGIPGVHTLSCIAGCLAAAFATCWLATNRAQALWPTVMRGSAASRGCAL